MTCRLKDLVQFNPKRNLIKNNIYPYADIASIPRLNRNIEYVDRKFCGAGSRFKNKDIIFSRILASKGSQTIKSALIDDLKNDGFGSTEFIVMSPKKQSDADFIYYITRFPKFKKYIIKNTSGTSRQRVSWQRLKYFEFEFPNEEYRKKASYILKLHDDLIQKNIFISKKLEIISKTFFKFYLTDLKINLDSLDYIKDQNLPNPVSVKRDGHIESLDSNINFLNGLALKKLDSGLPILKIVQLKKGSTQSAELTSPNIPEKYIVSNGDLIFSWSASLVVKMWFGGEAALNQHLFKVTSNSYPKWFQWLWCDFHLKKFKSIAKSKVTTMGHIQRKHLTEAKILVPSRSDMKKLNKIFVPILEQITLCNMEINRLEKLRDLILPKLISGTINLDNIYCHKY